MEYIKSGADTEGDKNLKNIAVIKGVKDIKAVGNHFWIHTDKDGIYDCFNEKGKKIGSIQAEAICESAYQHVPFMSNGKGGLVHESVKIVVKPQFEFNTENVPQVENGYWCNNVTMTDENHRFDFYNFQGKLVMSTTAEKNGWDYIIPQETVKYFYFVPKIINNETPERFIESLIHIKFIEEMD